MKKVLLTQAEAESLLDWIDCYFIADVQNSEGEIDNIQWVANICDIWRKCRKALGEEKGEEHD